MKKRSIVWILVLFLYILCISSVHVWAGEGQDKKEKTVDIETIRKKMIWFGDSRTVYLGRDVYGYTISKNRYIYNQRIVARRSTQYNWANGVGYKLLKKYIDKYPEKMIIMNFGVNDIGHGNDHRKSYVNLIKRIHKNYPKAQLCVMSVNPVKASWKNPYAKSKKTANEMNEKIKRFNTYVKNNLPKGCLYIDTNCNVSFNYIDGLHYTKATYRRIEKYVIKILEKSNS